MMHDVVWDIESLSTKANAVVLSIGAVKVNNYANAIVGDSFYAVLPLHDQLQYGRQIDLDTVKWWMNQSAQARTLFDSKPTYPSVELTLGALQLWMNDEVGKVWGNGADFDNLIIGTLYDDYHIKRPWTFRQNMCFRTLRALYTDIKHSNSGVAHNALDDAISQAEWLIKIRKAMQDDQRLL